MIRTIFNIFCMLILLINTCSGSSQNDYIKNDNRMQGLVKFIKKRNGSVTWSGEALKYNIEVDGHKAIIDFSSNKNIKATMSALFPDTIFVKFNFSNAFSYSAILIENRTYGKTDKFGNYNNGEVFDTKPGLQHIQLIKNNKILSKTELLIFMENDINCSGKKLRCKQLSF